MINSIKPEKLKSGDKIATVSLSWGGAGELNLLWRYEQGKRKLGALWSKSSRDAQHIKGRGLLKKKSTGAC